jgi:hypothetical protein
MICASTSELHLIQIAAGRPALAWATSASICSRSRFFSVSGETAIRSSSAGSA